MKVKINKFGGYEVTENGVTTVMTLQELLKKESKIYD